MATLKALKQCSKIIKYAVFGFIRQESKESSLPHIPTMIEYLCLSYYSPNTDFFDKKAEKKEIKIKLSIDQLTATVVTTKRRLSHFAAIYGYQWIDSLSTKEHEWTFKINKISGIIEFGLTSNNDEAVHPFLSYNYGYSIRIDRCHCLGQANEKQGVQNMPYVKDKYKQYIKHPTDIIVTLNNGHLVIAINGQKFNFRVFSSDRMGWKWIRGPLAIQTGKDIKYRMAVTMRDLNDSVTLQKYTMKY